MWVLLNDSFLSIVQHREHPEKLLVRSRIKGDIERAIPSAEVFEMESADYYFRAVVDREVVKSALRAAVDRIDYDNFKGSIRDHGRHAAYFQVWSVLEKAFGHRKR